MQRAVRATRLGILLLAAAAAGCQSMDEEMVQTTQPEKMPSLNVVDITAADRSNHQPMMAEDVDSFGALGQPPLLDPRWRGGLMAVAMRYGVVLM